MQTLTQVLELLVKHRGKTLGLITGFIVSIMLLTLGLFKTFFIAGCCTIGYIIGKKIDNHEDFRNLIDRILPPHD